MQNTQYSPLGRFKAELLYRLGYRKNQATLYAAALAVLGTDASPADIAPDEYGCAESVSTILSTLMNFQVTVSTAKLYKVLFYDNRFMVLLQNPDPGTIILSPTGQGNGKIVGHVGIVGDGGKIMANNSATGKWEYTYTLESWHARWALKGDMPVYYFGLL